MGTLFEVVESSPDTYSITSTRPYLWRGRPESPTHYVARAIPCRVLAGQIADALNALETQRAVSAHLHETGWIQESRPTCHIATDRVRVLPPGSLIPMKDAAGPVVSLGEVEEWRVFLSSQDPAETWEPGRPVRLTYADLDNPETPAFWIGYAAYSERREDPPARDSVFQSRGPRWVSLWEAGWDYAHAVHEAGLDPYAPCTAKENPDEQK